MPQHLCLSGCEEHGGAAAALTNETAVDMAFHKFLWFAEDDVEQPIMLHYCWLRNKDLISISLMLMNISTATSKGAAGSSSKLLSSGVFKLWLCPTEPESPGSKEQCVTTALLQGKCRGWHGSNKAPLSFCLLFDSWDKLSSAVRSCWSLGCGYGGRVSSTNFQSFKNSPNHKVILESTHFWPTWIQLCDFQVSKRNYNTILANFWFSTKGLNKIGWVLYEYVSRV